MAGAASELAERAGDGEGQAVELHIDENGVAARRGTDAGELARALRVARQLVDAAFGCDAAHEILARAVFGEQQVAPRCQADVVGHVEHARARRLSEQLELVAEVAATERELEDLSDVLVPTRRAANVHDAVAEEDAFTTAKA